LIGGRSGGSVERSWLIERDSKGEVGNEADGNSSAYRRKRTMVDTQ
jgi:hypothetical protein